MPGKAVETRDGQAAFTSLVGTEDRRFELAIGESLYFLERESALAADRPQTTTYKLVICRHRYLLHTTERTALNALSSSVPNITRCVQELRPKRLRKQGAIRSRSPWPPAEPWPERPAAKRQERETGSTSVETTGHPSVRALEGGWKRGVPQHQSDSRPGGGRRRLIAPAICNYPRWP